MKSHLILKNTDRRYTLGVVYEPDVVDTQGDFAKADTIEHAAWEFMSQLQRSATIGKRIVQELTSEVCDSEIDVTDLLAKGAGDGLDDQHLQVENILGTIVESYIAPCDLTLDGEAVKKGAWLLGVIWTPEMWEKIKSGERTGLSLYGVAESAEA